MNKAFAVWVLCAACCCATAADNAWQMTVTGDGAVQASLNRAPVVQANYNFWGANWKYAGTRFSRRPPGSARAAFAGTVDALGLKIDLTVTSPKPNQLRYVWRIAASRDLSGIVGGGLEFNLKPDSPSMGGRAGKTTLLANNTGWSWPVGDRRHVRVEFDKPIGSVYFERGNTAKIRAMFVGKALARGTHTVTMTVSLPAGGRVARSLAERYGPAETASWFRDAMAHDRSPVDLSFLNHRPAGKHGFVRARGDKLVFADGVEARFWGGNIAAYAIFASKEQIAAQAGRIAQLGYNLMRFHHHDSMRWVSRTVIDKTRGDSQHLDAEVMDRLDYWIKCLRDEGVYVWLDLHVGRLFKDGDGIATGYAEMAKRGKAGGTEAKGYCYFNPRVEQLMKDFNARYLNHVNRYTKLAYKDDPAVMGLLITNENDITSHFGNLMLPDKNNPVHNRIFDAAVRAFATKHGLEYAKTWRTWEPGPSKLFLADHEYRWNRRVLDHLGELGVKVPVSTTQMWGNMALFGLPSLTAGGIIDVHSYGRSEALSANPRYAANYVSYLATGQAVGKPVAITEWNVPYPNVDRFTAPLYVASISALQGWDAPMIYNYSQRTFDRPSRPGTWSSFPDPALTGMMPAAAVLYRRGDVREAKRTYAVRFDRKALYYRNSLPKNTAALRTLVEQSKVSIALPDVKELDWDAAGAIPPGVTVVADIDRDFIPAGQGAVRSDTGELTRRWDPGYQTIDTPRTQAAHGWIGGRRIALAGVTFNVTTPKAALAVTSLDGKPIAQSRRILITAIARVAASPGGRMPLLSEPVAGTLAIAAPAGLTLRPLADDGKRLTGPKTSREGGAYAIKLPLPKGTHWFMLED